MSRGTGEGEAHEHQPDGAEPPQGRFRRLAASPWLWRSLALLYLSVVSYAMLRRSSILIDGNRVFFLDDDQMVSMRYARNLAEGNGLVWNVGERVEGYTNPLWTLVMAALHKLPLGDTHTSAAVLVVNWLLSCAVLLLAERLLVALRPDPGVLRPVLLLSLAGCLDVLFWSVNGFETPLLCAIFLWAVCLTLRDTSDSGGLRLSTALLIGLLPLVRSDGLHVAAGVCALVLARSAGRRLTTAARLLPALLPFVAHLVFRFLYYGELLPNTFYLRVSGVAGRPLMGFWYLTAFGYRYGVPLVLGAASLFVGAVRDRRDRAALAVALAISSFYALAVGGDVFPGSRFLAHLVPALIAVALAGIPDLVPGNALARRVLALIVLVSVSTTVGVHGRAGLARLRFPNGHPEFGAVAGTLIRESTGSEASVAVLAAGAVPYFSHRRCIDLLGKCDRLVARLPARGAQLGHNKMDAERSLGRRPDLVVVVASLDQVLEISGGKVESNGDFVERLVRSETFERDYLPNAVSSPFLRERMSVFVRRDSTLVKSLEPALWPPVWRQPTVRWEAAPR